MFECDEFAIPLNFYICRICGFRQKPLMLKWLAKQRDSGNKRDLRQILENFDEC